jgi:hypothetical protein
VLILFFVAGLGVSFPSPLPSIFFFRRRFLSRLPADTPVTQLRVLRALLHKTKKGNHATAAMLHVSRVTSQLRPCLVLARGFAPVCAPCVKKTEAVCAKKQTKKRKKQGKRDDRFGNTCRNSFRARSVSSLLCPPSRFFSLSIFFRTCDQQRL